MNGPDPADPIYSRTARWVVGVLIGLGVCALLAAGIGVSWFAARKGTGLVLAGATSARASVTPPTTRSEPLAPAPTTEDDRALDPDDENAALPLSPPAEPTGPRWSSEDERATLPLGATQPIWGPSSASVTVALFGDLECPFTRETLRQLERLAPSFAPRVRFAFYQRPLSEHPYAEQAAQTLAAIAIAAGPGTAFETLWRAARGDSTPSEFAHWLEQAGVKSPLSALGNDAAVRARLDADLRLAVTLDVKVTPTLFVNGRRLLGAESQTNLSQLIHDELRAASWLSAQGLSSARVYEARLRSNLIGLTRGAERRSCVPSDDAPALGPSDAPLTLVEFSDFECAHCRAFEPVLRAVLARYPGKVRRVWRSFLAPKQARARRAAAFALAARELGGERAFWAVHDALFALDAAEIGEGALERVASGLGLDMAKLSELARDARVTRRLQLDHELARSLELGGTPTLFINGRSLPGAVPAAVLDAVVREELSAVERVLAHGTALSAIPKLLCSE